MPHSNQYIHPDLSILQQMDRSERKRKARNLSLSDGTWDKVKIHANVGNRGQRGQVSRLITLAVLLLHSLLSKRPQHKDAYNLGWTLIDIIPGIADRLELLDNVRQLAEGMADRLASIVGEKDR